MSHRAVPRAWFDHFVVAVDDLDRGIAEFEQLTGVRPVRGGEHPTLGTWNALVSLGADQYFEILAPRPGAVLAPMVRGVEAFGSLTPFLWALATDDLAGLRQRVMEAGFDAHDIVPGARDTPDGEALRWSMCTLAPPAPPIAPFFIAWDPETVHPSASTPAGCTLDGFTISTPDVDTFGRLLDAAGFTARITGGKPGLTIRLHTPRGPVTLGG